MENGNSCRNCQNHRMEQRPKVVEEMFDSVVAFEDEDVSVYYCTYFGKEIGQEPLTSCESHVLMDTSQRDASLAKADDWIAKWEERQRARDRR